LTDHRVVLTGAASGIGAATLRAFHEEVAAVEVITLDRVELPEDLAALSTQHVIVDLSDAGSIDRAVKEIAIDAEIDALCNVAGIPGTADSATVLAVNFLGLRHLTESLVDRIRDGGSIVNVASIAGAQWMTNLSDVRRLIATVSFADGVDWVRDQPMDGARAYNFSKEAVLVWTMANCLRWWDRQIRVNSVSPGPVETPILDDFRDSMGHDRIAAAISAVGRAGRPEDVAPAITFLASRKAPWVNGVNIVTDGGLLAASVAALPV
jgi:NAD(P)-dependent dehydrogenase (short-subunit alcohol dehydrogenase family)